MQLPQSTQSLFQLGRLHLPVPRHPGLLRWSSLGVNKQIVRGSSEKGSASPGPEGAPLAKDAAAANRSTPDKPAGKDTKKHKLQGLLPTASGRHLLLHAGHLLKDHFWPIIIIYAAKDTLSFLLHRLSQRLTNAAAEGIFGTSIPAAANPWWLYLESNFLESNVGYQACIVAFFILVLPLNILLSSLAASNTAVVCAPEFIGMQGGSLSRSSSNSSSSSNGGGGGRSSNISGGNSSSSSSGGSDGNSKDAKSSNSRVGIVRETGQNGKDISGKIRGENGREAETRPLASQAEPSGTSEGASSHVQVPLESGLASSSNAAGPSTQGQGRNGIRGSANSDAAARKSLRHAGDDQMRSLSEEGEHVEGPSGAAPSPANGNGGARAGTVMEGRGAEPPSTPAEAQPEGNVNVEQPSTAAAAGPAASVNAEQHSTATQAETVGSVDAEQASAAAQAATAGAANAESAQQQQQQQQGPGFRQSIKDGLREVKASLPSALAMLRRVWVVDLLFNLRALPLQGLSLLVLPVFWTVPRLLAIQMAVPAAIMEGRSGNDALSRSAKLMEGFKSSFGWPFVALILGVRFIDWVRNAALTALPSRWWQEVIEMPILLTALFSFTKLLLIRLQDLIPLAAYIYALKLNEEESQGSSPGASEPTLQGHTK